MDKEFHFYVVYILAREAGFDEGDCHTIAYSSQYVDDNTIGLTLNQGTPNEYRNLISQTMDIFKPKNRLIRIYFSFHFVPGDYSSETARRRDGKMSILNTTPNSYNANNLMDAALKTENLYRIGVASHCYADTWAHQNFIGYFDSMNALKDFFARLTPDGGHADARDKPDVPALIWEDKRLISKNRDVRNKERFLEAAKNIFMKYYYYLNPNGNSDVPARKWRSLEEQLDKAIGKDSEKARRKKYKKKRHENYKTLLRPFTDYNVFDWIDEAIETRGPGLPDLRGGSLAGAMAPYKKRYRTKPGFRNSNWFKFQESVKAHNAEAQKLYKPIFDQLELENL